MDLKDLKIYDPGFFKNLNQSSGNLSNSEKWNQNPPLVFFQNKYISIRAVYSNVNSVRPGANEDTCTLRRARNGSMKVQQRPGAKDLSRDAAGRNVNRYHYAFLISRI